MYGVFTALGGFGPGSIPILAGISFVYLAFIVWFVVPTPDAPERSGFGLGGLPDDHPVRERLQQD